METTATTKHPSRIKTTTTKSLFSIIGNAIMLIYAFTCIYPVFWLIYSSFKDMAEFDANIIALPSRLYLENYIYVFTHSDMPTYMLNSVRNTLIALIFILLFAFVNGFFLSRYKFKGRGFLYSYYMLGMLIPVHALLVPIYIVMSKTGLTNTWFTVSLPLIAFNLPISLFLCESYIGTIPREIDEAAAIDGASFSRTLFSIILPMAKPIIVTAGILAFFNCWNEFIYSLVLLKDKALYTIPLGLTLFKGTYSTNYPVMMTSMIIGILPAMILYFSFSKQIIQGMISGAVKG